MEQNSYKYLILNIKKIMKNRQITYRDLALKMKVSESGLKKTFQAKDASFAKLNQICGILGVRLVDVLHMESHWAPDVLTFTPQQEEFLLDDEQALDVFFLIAYDGLSLAETQEKLELDRSTITKIVRKLDRLGLVEWMPSDEVRFPRDGIVLWEDKGELVEHVKRTWSVETLLDCVNTAAEKPKNSFHMKYLKLSEQSHAELQDAVRSLFEEYQRKSRREMFLHGHRNLRGTKIVCAISEGSFVGKS